MPAIRYRFLAIIALLVLGWATTHARLNSGLPPVDEAGGEPAFAGAQACAACHQDIHDTWKTGRHSKMLQLATPASVKGDFSKNSVTLRGDRYKLRAANGGYFITESFLTGKEQEHRVEYTLGSRRIQHYLTTIEKGWIVVLPPSWDVQRQKWLHNMDVADRPDLTGQQHIQQWNYNCVGCHVSQQDNNFNPVTGEYATRWMDFGTSCERCHGPGAAHIQKYAGANGSSGGGERLIVRPTRLDPKTSSMICAQCHSLRNVIYPGYTAGENYYDYFQPVLEYGLSSGEDSSAYWADGRPRRFSNDAIGLGQSQCFLRGGATCTTCHQNPHLPDVDRNASLDPRNNGLCTQCHQDVGARLEAHTRHGAGSTGSSCVECHMPKTVVSIKSTMRDHTISVPAPENTVRFGIPNACTECHAGKKASWAIDVLEKWWPNGRRAKLVERATVFTAARAKQPEALDRLIAIASDASIGPLIQTTAVGYLRDYADPRALTALLAATKADHPAIRSAAISGLGHRVAPNDQTRSALLAALDDPQRAIRIATLMSLIQLGSEPFRPEDEVRFRSASRELATLARSHQDDADLQRNLGAVHLVGKEFDLAADALQISLGLDPERGSVKFLLALARFGQLRLDDALKLLKQVPRSDPFYGAAQERIKKLEQPR